MERDMKGGKGGRKRNAPKAPDVVAPRSGPSRGAPKRDWGAIESDDDGAAAVPVPQKEKKRKE